MGASSSSPVVDESNEASEAAGVSKLSIWARRFYVLLGLSPFLGFMGEIAYQTFRPIRTDYNSQFLEDQAYISQTSHERIDEFRRATPRREIAEFRNLENVSEAHKKRIDELNDLRTENWVALSVSHVISPYEGRMIRHEAAMQFVAATESYVELRSEFIRVGYEGLETLDPEVFWTNCAEECRKFYWDWDAETYTLRMLGPKGHAMVAGRAVQRRYRALRRSLLSIGPDFRLPFIYPGD